MWMMEEMMGGGEQPTTPCGNAQEEWQSNVWEGACSQAVSLLDTDGKCTECTGALEKEGKEADPYSAECLEVCHDFLTAPCPQDCIDASLRLYDSCGGCAANEKKFCGMHVLPDQYKHDRESASTLKWVEDNIPEAIFFTTYTDGAFAITSGLLGPAQCKYPNHDLYATLPDYFCRNCHSLQDLVNNHMWAGPSGPCTADIAAKCSDMPQWHG